MPVDPRQIISDTLRQHHAATSDQIAGGIIEALKEAGIMMVPTELVNAAPKITRTDLRAGMVCRMKKGGLRRIDDAACGGNGNWVKWTRVDPGAYQGRGGRMWAVSFADAIAEVLSHG